MPKIAVDGLAASGKTSLMRALAKRPAHRSLIGAAARRGVAPKARQKND